MLCPRNWRFGGQNWPGAAGLAGEAHFVDAAENVIVFEELLADVVPFLSDVDVGEAADAGDLFLWDFVEHEFIDLTLDGGEFVDFLLYDFHAFAKGGVELSTYAYAGEGKLTAGLSVGCVEEAFVCVDNLHRNC